MGKGIFEVIGDALSDLFSPDPYPHTNYIEIPQEVNDQYLNFMNSENGKVNISVCPPRESIEECELRQLRDEKNSMGIAFQDVRWQRDKLKMKVEKKEELLKKKREEITKLKKQVKTFKELNGATEIELMKQIDTLKSRRG